MKISNVIFDFGCVLSLVPVPADFDAIRQALGVDATTFDKVYWRDRDAYDLDHLSTEAYWQGVGKLAGLDLSAHEALQLAELDRDLWSRENPVMVKWVSALRNQGVNVALISNMSMYIGLHLRRTATWLSQCDPICFSGELKLLKPDPAIYEACLTKMNATPAQSLFVDDREVNVSAARKLGMQGVVFSTVEQLQHDLRPFNLADSLAGTVAKHSQR